MTTPWPQVGVLSVPNGGVLLVERFEYRKIVKEKFNT
jgi:hypothetical protein